MNNTEKKIKRCFWIFVFLLLTEGIFRRWLLPELNNLFLVIRDPIVIYVVLLGYLKGYLKGLIPNLFMVLGGLTFLSALFFGHGNIVVAFYGVRIIFFYFPFIYVCSRVLNRDDILKTGSILVKMIIPMIILNIVQFFSPQSSFVNIGVGGSEEGAGFGGAMGYYRPPGIFSFISALTDYYACAFVFLLYFLMDNKVAKKFGLTRVLLIVSLIGFVISLAVCISRTHVVQTAYIMFFFLFILINQPSKLRVILPLFVLVFISIPILLLNENVQLFAEVFFARFDSANETEGGLGSSAVERTFGWMFRAIEKAPTSGFGTGLFSNFGLTYIYGHLGRYPAELRIVEDSTEMEWGRVICEDGLILGILVLMLRFSFAFLLFRKSYYALKNRKDYLVWLTMSFACFSIVIFQLKAAYNLGFMTLISISCLTLLTEGKRKTA